MKHNVDNIIFLRDRINIRSGGPAGYIANLKEGLEKNNIENIAVISFKDMECRAIKRKKQIVKYLTRLIPIHSVKNKVLDKIYRKYDKINYLRDQGLYRPRWMNKYFAHELDKYSFKTITCHSVYDIFFVKEYIVKRKLKAKILLQSHSPEAPSKEFYNALISAGVSLAKAKQRYNIAEKIEREAFEIADTVLFPTPDAMEPYHDFHNILSNKDIRFITTGVKPFPPISKSRIQLLHEFGVKTPFVISYIGRHNHVKGYDILKNMAAKILAKRYDVTFLIGGAIGTIEPLRYERWIELGIVKPNEVLSVSDAFILPNKQTYFDLILLEVLSMGVPVFASNTGGNKSVAKQTGCINLYDSPEKAIESILDFLTKDQKYRDNIAAKTLDAYKKYYTQDIFAQNYAQLIKGLI